MQTLERPPTAIDFTTSPPKSADYYKKPSFFQSIARNKPNFRLPRSASMRTPSPPPGKRVYCTVVCSIGSGVEQFFHCYNSTPKEPDRKSFFVFYYTFRRAKRGLYGGLSLSSLKKSSYAFLELFTLSRNGCLFTTKSSFCCRTGAAFPAAFEAPFVSQCELHGLD